MNVSETYSRITDYVVKFKRYTILDDLAQSTLADIPFVGKFLLSWYNSIEDENENKTSDVLQFLEKLLAKNEFDFNFIIDALDKFEHQIIDQKIHLEQILDSEFKILLKATLETQKATLETQKATLETQKTTLETQKDVQNLSHKIGSVTQESSTNMSSLDSIYYVVIEPKTDSNALDHVANAINLRLEENHQRVPFVPFKNIDVLLKKQKLYFFGSSGIGKSRLVYELIKKQIKKFNKIYIINPQHVTSHERISTSLTNLVTNLDDNSLVVWDKFPDPLLQSQNVDVGRDALMKISSSRVSSLLINLSPDYLELYNVDWKIPLLSKYEVVYSQSQIQKIIEKFGNELSSYEQSFKLLKEYGLKNISKSIWQFEPSPTTILNLYRYVKEKLDDNSNFDSIQIQGNLDYFKNQFDTLSQLDSRTHDLDLLFTVKLAYELNWDRSIENIFKMQKDIFNSSPVLNFEDRLSIWIYNQDDILSMHDTTFHAIKPSDTSMKKILNYIEKNFQILRASDKITLNLLYFLGTNVEHFLNSSSLDFPIPMVEYVSNHPVGSLNLSFGICNVFNSLNFSQQKLVLKFGSYDQYANYLTQIGEMHGKYVGTLNLNNMKKFFKKFSKYDDFLDGVGSSLAKSFSTFDVKTQNFLLNLCNSNSEFANGFSYGLGSSSKITNSKTLKRLSSLIEHNEAFDQGFGQGISSSIFSSDDLHHLVRLTSKLKKNESFLEGLGHGIGHRTEFLSVSLFDSLIKLFKNQESFVAGFLTGLGHSYEEIPSPIKNRIWSLAKNNRLYARVFARGLFQNIFDFNLKTISELLPKIKNNDDFGGFFGSNIPYNLQYVSDAIYDILLKQIGENSFTAGMGQSFGHNYYHLSEDVKSKLSKIEHSFFKESFCFGLGTGLKKSRISKSIWELGISSEFLESFAMGIGHNIDALSTFKEKISEQLLISAEFNKGFATSTSIHLLDLLDNDLVCVEAETNNDYATNLGISFSEHYLNLKPLEKQSLSKFISNSPAFEIGLGRGFAKLFMNSNSILQKKICAILSKNIQLRSGFAESIPKTMFNKKSSYLSKIKSIAKQNPHMMRILIKRKIYIS